MIALRIIPLRWADPESRKVLVHDESKPSERFAGEDGEGFYSVVQARVEWEADSSKRSTPESGTSWRHWFAKQVSPSGLPLYNVAYIGSQLVGVYIEHFSAPTDYDDHFEDTPLLTVGAAPDPQNISGGIAKSTLYIPGESHSPGLFESGLGLPSAHRLTPLHAQWLADHGYPVPVHPSPQQSLRGAQP